MWYRGIQGDLGNYVPDPWLNLMQWKTTCLKIIYKQPGRFGIKLGLACPSEFLIVTRPDPTQLLNWTGPLLFKY